MSQAVETPSPFWDRWKKSETLLSKFFNDPTHEEARLRWERQLISLIGQLETKIRFKKQEDYVTLRILCLNRLIRLCEYVRGKRYKNPNFNIDVSSWNGHWEPVILCQAYFLSPEQHLLDAIVTPYWKNDILPFVKRFKYGKIFDEVHLKGIVNEILLSRRVSGKETYNEFPGPCLYDGQGPFIIWLRSYLRSWLSLKDPPLLKSTRNVELLSNLDKPPWLVSRCRPEIESEIEARCSEIRDQFQQLSMTMNEDEESKNAISLRDLIIAGRIVDGVFDKTPIKKIAAQCGVSDKKIASMREEAFGRIIKEMVKKDRSLEEWEKHDLMKLIISVFADWGDDLLNQMLEFQMKQKKEGKQ